MYGIYCDIIDATKNALIRFEETKELLEYPEVQADKAYYLSVLSEYNHMKDLKDKLSTLTSAIEEEKAFNVLLTDARSDEERNEIYEEISSLKRIASLTSAALADALGCKHTEERAYCRFRLKEISSKFGMGLFSLIKNYLLLRDAKIEEEKVITAKDGFVREISFIAKGFDVITRLIPLTGTHRVYIDKSKFEELCFAVSPALSVAGISEGDLKIDVFHSHGAGGQNINKVETAVRVTYLPTGLSVVCQDERSQLKNKKRALETIEKKLKEQSFQTEKDRIEADIAAQYSKKNTTITFDALSNTMTDTRLRAFSKIPFPLTDKQFIQYIDGLIII